MYLGEPPFDPHGLAVRAGGHVAASQHAGQRVRRGIELGAQDAGESAFAGFDDGAGVVRDQPAQHGIGVLGVAQVPGAVKLVQARDGEAGAVADVVQPRGGFPLDRRPRRERVPGRVPARRRPGRAPSGGEGTAGGVPGRTVAPMMPARS